MKKNTIIGFLIGISLLCIAANNSVTYTAYAPYRLLRAEADENASEIGLTTEGDFAQKPAGAISLSSVLSAGALHYPVNAIQFIFCGGAAADKTFSWKIYAWRVTNGPAELLAYGTGTLGTQAVVKYPDSGSTATSKFWTDTLAISAQGLPKTFTLADYAGGNRVAKLTGDLCGYDWIYCEITSADGTTGVEAGDISVYYSHF